MIVDAVVQFIMGTLQAALDLLPDSDPATFSGVQIQGFRDVLEQVNSLIPVWPMLLMFTIFVAAIIPFTIFRIIIFIRYVLLP